MKETDNFKRSTILSKNINLSGKKLKKSSSREALIDNSESDAKKVKSLVKSGQSDSAESLPVSQRRRTLTRKLSYTKGLNQMASTANLDPEA